MKLNYTFILALLFLVIHGCDNNSATDQKKSSLEEISEKNKEKTVNETTENKNEPPSLISQLASLGPMTEAEMDAWMPEKIGDLERTYYKANSVPMMGIFMTKATFKDPNSAKELDISIMDGAGEKGSRAMSPFLNLKNLYHDKSDDSGYQNVITKNEMTMVQKYRNASDKFNLEFAPKNRYAIKIETKALSEEELWQAINQFKFENLQGI
ncbi:hypothetical protein J1N09_07545 [Aureitalea sp. L0-47]|uniref:hypothetical protein n=1 Tax=Aureitalea sp. L0-47 TaxID=2816962 RepID=UPI002237FB7E|nr:hypothetical protein [Aureitalea sp. L0-47]MCW5519687.1 hypothetical protein [Aureitalea sp. L0-47]